jgi:polyhydroxyalkanoate synthesis regulator phasin
MLKEVRQGLLAGLGALLLTKDKVDEAVRKLVKESKISKQEGERLVEELVSSGDRQWKELEESVGKSMRKGVRSLDIAGKKDVEALKRRVKKLEGRMTLVEELLQEKENPAPESE